MRLKRSQLLVTLLFLFGIQGALQSVIYPLWKKNYAPVKQSKNGFVSDSLSPDQIILQLFGFREFLSGILWVRADGFFDSGNYDAVLPMIRLCTVLDPRQIDIFSTGMWHIAYNFTDEEQRSDRRYVASALALGKEGAAQNPDTYEIFFETGWIWYHKIDDEYHNAVKWFELAHQRSDMQAGRKNLLSNAYQRNNQLDEALDLYIKLLAKANEAAQANQKEHMLQTMRDTVEGNLDTMIVRLVQRGTLAQRRGDYSSGQYDTNPPFDVGFSARVTVENPRVIRVEGTWNVASIGTRIRIVLRDKDMEGGKLAELDWDARDSVDLEPSRDVTFMQDQLFVKNRRFKKLIDMSKDPTMYPFSETKKNYVVEFYYNPRSAPPHIQDKFGFNGEGFTDSNFLRTDVRKDFVFDLSQKDAKGKYSVDPKLIEGKTSQRVMYYSMDLTREQLLRRGQWSMDGGQTPILTTKNFDPKKVLTVDEVIAVPTLRGQEGHGNIEPKGK
jgi:tetratricopeptide (TPR) repeat protein